MWKISHVSHKIASHLVPFYFSPCSVPFGDTGESGKGKSAEEGGFFVNLEGDKDGWKRRKRELTKIEQLIADDSH